MYVCLSKLLSEPLHYLVKGKVIARRRAHNRSRDYDYDYAFTSDSEHIKQWVMRAIIRRCDR